MRYTVPALAVVTICTISALYLLNQKEVPKETPIEVELSQPLAASTPQFEPANRVDESDDAPIDTDADLYSRFRAILAIENNQKRQAALEQFYADAIAQDPYELLDLIHSLDTEQLRIDTYLGAFTVWVEVDLPGFYEIENAILISVETDQAFAHIAQLEQIELSQALLWTDAIVQQKLKRTTIKQLIRNNAQSEPETIIEWALADESRQDYIPSIYKQIASQSPSQAMALYSWLESESIELQKNVMAQLIDATPPELIDDAYIEFISQISDEELLNLVIHIAMPKLTEAGQIDALDQLLSAVYDEEKYARMQSRLVAKWSKTDPELALDYTDYIEDNQPRVAAIASAMKAWAEKDYPSAETWLDERASSLSDVSQPASKLAVAGSYSAEHINSATNWLAKISNERVLKETAERVIRNWYEHSPKQAMSYLQQTQLISDEHRAKIIGYINKSNDK